MITYNIQTGTRPFQLVLTLIGKMLTIALTKRVLVEGAGDEKSKFQYVPVENQKIEIALESVDQLKLTINHFRWIFGVAKKQSEAMAADLEKEFGSVKVATEQPAEAPQTEAVDEAVEVEEES